MPIVPLPKSNKGEKPSKLSVHARSIRVDRRGDKQSLKTWKRVEIRESTKGKLLVETLHRKVLAWGGKESCAWKWHLVVRREINSPEKIKYSLSNVPSNAPIKRFAFMQTQRYWVARPFQDAKNQCGLG